MSKMSDRAWEQIYRCLSCGAEWKEGHIYSRRVAWVIHRNILSSSYRTGRVPIHDCPDGSMGTSVLVATRPKRTDLEKIALEGKVDVD